MRLFLCLLAALLVGAILLQSSAHAGKQYFVSSSDGEEQSTKDQPEVHLKTPEQEQSDEAGASYERRRMDQISRAARIHAQKIVSECPDNWEAQSCLKLVSDAYLTAAALYAETLENNGHKDEQGNIKEHCAASTAATRLDDIPAYAMRSAFVECSNEFYAIYERTKIMADQELAQLMVMAVLCMDKDPRCGLMESGLKASMNQ